MSLITLQQLQSICRSAQGRGRCAVFLPCIIESAPAFGINTPRRLAMFLGQVMHESAEFRHVRELGSNAYLAKYDTGRLAARLGNTPEADGDGQLYCGRGLIQITGAHVVRWVFDSTNQKGVRHEKTVDVRDGGCRAGGRDAVAGLHVAWTERGWREAGDPVRHDAGD